MIAFGPVPSRRLGRSLGINIIPPKHCTYSCTYCQVGRTSDMGIERRSFYDPETILADVGRHLKKTNEPVDYLTVVPDGEPTLDVHLGSAIELLRSLNLPIAVISNASLIDRLDVAQFDIRKRPCEDRQRLERTAASRSLRSHGRNEHQSKHANEGQAEWFAARFLREHGV